MSSTGQSVQRPDRPARGARREAIARAALRVFRQYGFRRAAVDDVARLAGVAKGTVYLYFPSKDALYRAAVEIVLGVMLDASREAAAAPGTPGERVAGVLAAKRAALDDALRGSPHAADLVGTSSVHSRDLVDAFDRKLEALLAGLLREAERAGQLLLAGSGLSARGAASLLLDAAHGLDTSSRGSDASRLAALARVFLAGLAAARRATPPPRPSAARTARGVRRPGRARAGEGPAGG
jgi:AcrR family transcriptional regulator